MKRKGEGKTCTMHQVTNSNGLLSYVLERREGVEKNRNNGKNSKHGLERTKEKEILQKAGLGGDCRERGQDHPQKGKKGSKKRKKTNLMGNHGEREMKALNALKSSQDRATKKRRTSASKRVSKDGRSDPINSGETRFYS